MTKEITEKESLQINKSNKIVYLLNAYKDIFIKINDLPSDIKDAKIELYFRHLKYYPDDFSSHEKTIILQLVRDKLCSELERITTELSILGLDMNE